MKPIVRTAGAAPRSGKGSALIKPVGDIQVSDRHGRAKVATAKAAGLSSRRTQSDDLKVVDPWVHFMHSHVTNVMAHDAVLGGMPGRFLIYLFDVMRALPRDRLLNAVSMSARTADRVKANPEKVLDARTADAIFRLESVRSLAQEVLGSADAANEWLDSEALGLEMRKPIDLLSTSPGAEAVKTLLQRMKFGVYA